MDSILLIQIVLAWILIIAVLLPFVRNDYWIFRIFEYPRNQKFFLAVATLASLFFTISYTTFEIVTTALLTVGVCYLAYKIWPYTFFAKKEMLSLYDDNIDKANQLKLFSANVYQDNCDYDKMLQQIRENDPDVIFLLETNKEWERHMDVLIKDYPNCLKKPLENTY